MTRRNEVAFAIQAALNKKNMYILNGYKNAASSLTMFLSCLTKCIFFLKNPHCFINQNKRV